VCANKYCQNCSKWVNPSSHQCNVKPLIHKPEKNNEKYLFADFECTQETVKHLANGESINKHIVNFAMTCDYNGVFWPVHGSIKEWVDYLTRDRTYEGYTIIFHNGQGYDFQLIVEEMQSRKNLNIPKMAMNGGKILTFTVSKGGKKTSS